MSVQWKIDNGIRCDLVGYSGHNLSGKRSPVQIFAGGNKRGTINTNDLRSLVIRTTLGTRITLVTEPGMSWQDHPWRVIRMLPGHCMPSARQSGLPGIRIPALDLLDGYDAKTTDPELECSYPYVNRVSEGTGWTFGHSGSIEGKVKLIRIERETVAKEDFPVERVAEAILAAGRDLPHYKQLLAAAQDAVYQELQRADIHDARDRSKKLS